MFKNLIFSLKKSKILAKIAKNHSKPIDLKDIINYTLITNKVRNELLDELFELLQKDKFTTLLLQKHNKTYDDLKKIIKVLEHNGGGQIVKGHYVAVSAISFLDTLQIILQYWNSENFKVNDFDDYNSNLFVSNKMIERFK